MPFKINNKVISAKREEEGVYTFPTLYKMDKMNRLTYHKLSVKGNQILASRGIVGMKETTYPPFETESKNAGKKNETTPHQQALLEAQSKWDAKVNKQGFTESQSKGVGGVRVCEDGSDKILPMLANKFTSKFSNYPCQVSPKIDGCRCIASLGGDGVVKLWSRTTKEFNFLETVRKHLLIILDKESLPRVDGELYSHTLPFTTITSIIRQKKKKSEHDHLMEYWIFDIPDVSGTMTYTDRLKSLKMAEKKYNAAIKNSRDRVLKFLYSTSVQSEKDVKRLHDEYVTNGYEGAMIRLADSKYEFYRSKNLLKYKEFTDSEFKVVDAFEGKGVDKGAIVFVCESEDGGERFNVRPRGTVEKRRWQFKNKDIYMGKMLTVRYQDTGVGGGCEGGAPPRFGVGIKFTDKGIVEAVDFRDYE